MAADKYLPLIPGGTYYLHNRAIGNEFLFRCNENYRYFLKKYAFHTCNICDTYCYCLLPKYFHLLVRIKSKEQVIEQYELCKNKQPEVYPAALLSDFIMERFGNWLNSYTKAFNKVYDRKGALFIDYTKREAIEEESSFRKTLHYIHTEPVRQQLATTPGKWEHSSYNSMLSNAPTLLLRKEVLNLFKGREQFMQFHQQAVKRR